MPLATGSRLGPYEILSSLGAGGMGEVYRARDTKLNRDVALKILPEAFTLDGDRIARFRREAQVLASLNHPNIAAIYGFEDSGSTHALVLELVEGPTLADRIAQGSVPLDEALPIARQIAEALEAAHEQGIIHRDLKPANIKVRADGTVKVLDFGLAKLADPAGAAQQAGPNVNVTASPTITSPAMMTGVGVILGTAAYMSPEQAKGRPADKRSDIWAFGCVLYEMLTGKRAFEGEDVSDTIAAVLRGVPDWTLLAADVPISIRTLVQRCVEKDRRTRIADISTARFVFDAPQLAGVNSPPPAESRAWRGVVVLLAGVIVASTVTAFLVSSLTRKGSSTSPVVRFPIVLPEDQQFGASGLRNVAISPDGSQLVYAADRRLYLRSMSDGSTQSIAGTEGNTGNPVFSPDGRAVAFFSASGSEGGARDILRSLLPRGTIKRVGLNGGMVTTICDAEFPLGISWSQDGIVFGQVSKGVMRVSPTGGEPELLARVDEGEAALGPQILPGGNALLFTLTSGITTLMRLPDNLSSFNAVWDKARIVVQSVKTGARRTLIEGGSDARYLATGHLVYTVGGTLRAAPFDLSQLTLSGGGAPVIEGVARTRYANLATGSTHLAVSDTGTIVYLPGPASATSEPQRNLAFFDRSGAVEPIKLPPMLYESPHVSPDGKQVAVSTDDGKNANVWICDLSGSAPPRQLTFQGRNRHPLWSVDGRRVVFQSDREGDAAIYWQPADGRVPAERLTKAEARASHVPQSWSPAGTSLAFSVETPSGFALWMYDLREKRQEPFGAVRSATVPPAAAFSPDGGWIAYQSGEVPSPELFVQPFPPTGAFYRVAGGRHARWSPDGTQLFFTQQDRVLAVTVTRKPNFQLGNPKVVARGLSSVGMQPNYDVAARDGSRLIGPVTAAGFAPARTTAVRQIDVVLNWFTELQQRVPTR